MALIKIIYWNENPGPHSHVLVCAFTDKTVGQSPELSCHTPLSTDIMGLSYQRQDFKIQAFGIRIKSVAAGLKCVPVLLLLCNYYYMTYYYYSCCRLHASCMCLQLNIVSAACMYATALTTAICGDRVAVNVIHQWEYCGLIYDIASTCNTSRCRAWPGLCILWSYIDHSPITHYGGRSIVTLNLVVLDIPTKRFLVKTVWSDR